MLKYASQPQLEQFFRVNRVGVDSVLSPSPPIASAAAETAGDEGHTEKPSRFEGGTPSASSARLKDCALGPLTLSNSSDSNAGLDNKIEQAMDLVKSHLMFAVREEIELLKEQIKNLESRNKQLEHENAVLMQSASSETLIQLQTVPITNRIREQ